MMLNTLMNRFPLLTFKERVSLAPFTYMKVGGPAAIFVEVESKNELFELCAFSFQSNIPFVVLGGASNVLIPDQGLDKLVIRNKTSAIDFVNERNQRVEVVADSGVVTAVLANETMRRGYAGLEYFVGVPGTIGGAIVNNSHFSAKELIGNLVTSVEVCTSLGNIEHWNVDVLLFDYDFSVFHEKHDILLSATFDLSTDDPDAIRERMVNAAKHRSLTQPIGLPSSGCMFKNPVISEEQFVLIKQTNEIPESAVRQVGSRFQIAAGFLIDRAGLKGKTVGGAVVSDKHATFLINKGGATATDVLELTEQVEVIIKEKFGIILEREVFFL